MDDALLVGRAMGGDLDSFGQLYDRYFNRIYDFCWRITRDADEAADATQDVFMKAMQGLPGLAKASSFKSWLFTIAHNVAVTRAERAGRTTPLPVPSHEEAFGSFDVPDPSRLDNPELVAEDHEIAGLVWEAASALNPRDYALLDLHVRQGLESAEIAQVMNVSKGNAYTMVSRMKSAAADVIGGYVVARRGSKDCEELRRVVAPFDIPPYSEEARRAVDAHIRDCDVCQRARKSLVPLEIFGSFAAVPAPFALKGDIWRGIAGSWPWGDGAALVAAGSAPGPQEFVPQDQGGDGSLVPVAAAAGGAGGGGTALWIEDAPDSEGGNKWVVFAVAVLGLLVVAFAVAGGLILAGAVGDDDGAAIADNRTATAEGSPAASPSVGLDTPTPEEEPTDTPEPEDDETPTATAPVEATNTVEPAATDTAEPEPTNTPRRTTPAPATPTPPPPVTPGGPTATPTQFRIGR
jgi:RNA polymerase sigma factor (sigma-70 family)